MADLPITKWTRICKECDEARLVKVDLVLNEAEDGYDEVPTFLEDTGNSSELLKAKEIAANHYAKSVIKMNATADQIAAYHALINDIN